MKTPRQPSWKRSVDLWDGLYPHRPPKDKSSTPRMNVGQSSGISILESFGIIISKLEIDNQFKSGKINFRHGEMLNPFRRILFPHRDRLLVKGFFMKKLYLVALFLCCGCESLAQQQYEQQITDQREQAQIEQLKADHCTKIGAPPGSPNYFQCREDLDNRLAMIVAAAAGRPNTQTYQSPLPQQDFTIHHSPATTCTSNYIGKSLYTNCN